MVDHEPSIAQQKRRLRAQLRAQRRALSPREQRMAAAGIVRQLRRSAHYCRMKRVALYWAMDGEVNLTALMRQLHRDGKAVYLPVLDPLSPQLRFRRWHPGSRMQPNHFGIPEPEDRRAERPVWCLDWVLMPLVGFDAEGGRLGMGGGFYDRTFADEVRWPRQPRRLGIAHECQRVASVPKEGWDLPLIGVITDQRWYGSS